MDPLTALLFSLWIAGYFVRNVHEDAVFKARGEDPPSFRRQQERWKRREQRAAAGPGPARKFFGNAWADAWAHADERRSRRVEKATASRRNGDAEQDRAAAEDEAYELNERLKAAEAEAETRVRPADGTSGWKYRPMPPPLPRLGCDWCGREVPLQSVSPGSGDLQLCSACNPVSYGPPPVPDPQPQPAPDPPQQNPDQTPSDPQPDPTPADPADNVVQFVDWQRPNTDTTSKESTMSAEITGLRSAIVYANDSANAAESAATQTEIAIAGLHAGGTSGPAIAQLQTAMESLHSTASHFRGAAAALTQQLQVTEAYAANRGAGTREFVTSE